MTPNLRFEELLEREADGLLTPAEQAELDALLEADEALAGEAALDHQMLGLLREAGKGKAPAALMASVLAALPPPGTATILPVAPAPPVVAPRRSRLPLGLIAAASLAGIIAGTAYLLNESPSTTTTETATATEHFFAQAKPETPPETGAGPVSVWEYKREGTADTRAKDKNDTQAQDQLNLAATSKASAAAPPAAIAQPSAPMADPSLGKNSAGDLWRQRGDLASVADLAGTADLAESEESVRAERRSQRAARPNSPATPTPFAADLPDRASALAAVPGDIQRILADTGRLDVAASAAGQDAPTVVASADIRFLAVEYASVQNGRPVSDRVLLAYGRSENGAGEGPGFGAEPGDVTSTGFGPPGAPAGTPSTVFFPGPAPFQRVETPAEVREIARGEGANAVYFIPPRQNQDRSTWIFEFTSNQQATIFLSRLERLDGPAVLGIDISGLELLMIDGVTQITVTVGGR